MNGRGSYGATIASENNGVDSPIGRRQFSLDFRDAWIWAAAQNEPGTQQEEPDPTGESGSIGSVVHEESLLEASRRSHLESLHCHEWNKKLKKQVAHRQGTYQVESQIQIQRLSH